jgi:hypothetical protein
VWINGFDAMKVKNRTHATHAIDPELPFLTFPNTRFLAWQGAQRQVDTRWEWRLAPSRKPASAAPSFSAKLRSGYASKTSRLCCAPITKSMTAAPAAVSMQLFARMLRKIMMLPAPAG